MPTHCGKDGHSTGVSQSRDFRRTKGKEQTAKVDRHRLKSTEKRKRSTAIEVKTVHPHKREGRNKGVML